MEEPQNTEKPTVYEVLLSLLLGAYFFYVLLWFTPASVLKTKFFAPISTAWLFCGLNQSWALFSPSIREMNYYPSAVVTFEDGSKVLWEPPLMDRLNLFERFKREKFRKWSIDSLPWARFKNYWVDFARYVGREFYNPVNKPVLISMNLRWIEIPKPSEHLLRQDEMPPRTKFAATFCYRYTDKDFQ